MRRLCFTVDVDRDVNECAPGRREAASLGSDRPRFSSSEKGTNIILDMLDSIGIGATFFAEAATLRNIDASFGRNEVAMHGLDHEDMTGEISGIRLTDAELKGILQTSSEIITDATGKTPKGFRAPYMRSDARLMGALADFGLSYDSSLYAEAGTAPYRTNGITEVPVSVSVDGNGKRIYGYLWQMHEGVRPISDYIAMAEKVTDGVLVIATHGWHMVESRTDGIMDTDRLKKNIGDTCRLLETLLDKGFKASLMMDMP